MSTLTKREKTQGTGRQCRADAKWALLLTDTKYPMPRTVVPEELVREQACVPDGYLLARDHNTEHDPVIPRGAEIDLRLGNVFKLVKESDAGFHDTCESPAKLAWFVDDRWELTVKPRQSGSSIRRLHDVPENYDLLRDIESPDDELICGADDIDFADGPVFISRSVSVSVQVNNDPVTFDIREPLVSQIKETAQAQGLPVGPDFALYQVFDDDSFGAALPNDTRICLMEGMEFRCVDTDDNS